MVLEADLFSSYRVAPRFDPFGSFGLWFVLARGTDLHRPCDDKSVK